MFFVNAVRYLRPDYQRTRHEKISDVRTSRRIDLWWASSLERTPRAGLAHEWWRSPRDVRDSVTPALACTGLWYSIYRIFIIDNQPNDDEQQTMRKNKTQTKLQTKKDIDVSKPKGRGRRLHLANSSPTTTTTLQQKQQQQLQQRLILLLLPI